VELAVQLVAQRLARGLALEHAQDAAGVVDLLAERRDEVRTSSAEPEPVPVADLGRLHGFHGRYHASIAVAQFLAKGRAPRGILGRSMRTRPAAPADVDRLVEIHFRAFPDPRPEEPRRRRFVANPLGSLADAWVAEDDGVVLGHAFAFSLGAWFGGRRVPVTGIASVGVAPEARGRGVATALLARVHEVARARGLTMTQLALGCVRSRWYVGATIVGATTLAQLDEDIAAGLTDLDAATLADIAEVQLRYPNPAGY